MREQNRLVEGGGGGGGGGGVLVRENVYSQVAETCSPTQCMLQCKLQRS